MATSCFSKPFAVCCRSAWTLSGAQLFETLHECGLRTINGLGAQVVDELMRHDSNQNGTLILGTIQLDLHDHRCKGLAAQ